LAPDAFQADEPVLVNESVTFSAPPALIDLGVLSEVQDTPLALDTVGVGTGVDVLVGAGEGVVVGLGVFVGGAAVRVAVAVGLGGTDVPVGEAAVVDVAVVEGGGEVGVDTGPPTPGLIRRVSQ
jgi:hypothetical protein